MIYVFIQNCLTHLLARRNPNGNICKFVQVHIRQIKYYKHIHLQTDNKCDIMASDECNVTPDELRQTTVAAMFARSQTRLLVIIRRMLMIDCRTNYVLWHRTCYEYWSSNVYNAAIDIAERAYECRVCVCMCVCSISRACCFLH